MGPTLIGVEGSAVFEGQVVPVCVGKYLSGDYPNTTNYLVVGDYNQAHLQIEVKPSIGDSTVTGYFDQKIVIQPETINKELVFQIKELLSTFKSK